MIYRCITWVTQHILSFIRATAKSKKVSGELIGKYSALSESLTEWPLVRQSSTSTQGLKQMNFWEINLYLHVIESLRKPQWQPSWQRHKTKGFMSRKTVLHTHYKFLCIYLLSSAQQRPEVTKFCIFRTMQMMVANS